jgi:zeaxanthin glucosyltransferase
VARIAILQAPFASHLGLPTRVARVLHQAGHHVVVLAPGHELARQHELLGGDPIEVRADPFAPAVWERLRALGRPPGAPGAAPAARAALAGATAAHLSELLELLAGDRVELIVHDAMAVWGALAAGMLRLPRVASIIAHTLEPAPAPAGEDPALSALRRRAEAAQARFAALAGRPAAGRGDRTFVYSSPRLAGAEFADPTCCHVGPLETLAPAPGAEPALASLGENPLVLVALGTLVSDQPGLYRRLLEALCAEPLDVVLAAGERAEGEARAALAELSPRGRVRVCARVRQPAVLERCALFVTHAGFNSVLEALLAGVPMLCHPVAGDQSAGAARVAAIGAGQALSRGSVQALRAQARELVRAPEWRAAARAAGAELRATGGPDLVVSAVEELLAGRGRR